MGRQTRIEFEGAIYHVIQRGNNKDYIFKSKKEKQALLGLLRQYQGLLEYDCLGFAIMDNHYHIIIKTNGAEISKVMHRVNTEFAKTYNRMHKRSGHVFENRYKGILVKDNKYLLSLLRYVHQNPVKAKMCHKVSDYQWSSDKLFRYNQKSKGVHIGIILDLFSKDRNQALIEYAKFMDDDTYEKSEDFEETEIIGESTDMNTGFSDKDSKGSLDDILKELTTEKEYTLIKQASRKRSLTPIKRRYIDACIKNNYTLLEIGLSIGISQPAVSKMMSQEV